MNPDPNQPITPPIPPVESEVTPPTPPPAPPTPVDIPQTTPTPPPPPPPDVTTDTKVKWGAGKVVGAIAVVVILVVGLAAGIFLSQRQQNVKESQASGSAPNISGPNCSGNSDGIECHAPSNGSVYKFICSGNVSECGNGVANPISESGPSSAESAGIGTPCNQTVQIDAFNIPQCRNAGAWVCNDHLDSYAVWYTGECPTVPTVTPIPTTPPTSNDPSGFVNVSCGPNGQMQIRGSAIDPDAPETSLQLHLYFDSDPSDNNAAVLTDTVTATNGRFARNLPDSVARYAGTGPAVVLNDNQNHVVKAYAINAPGTSGANNELDNSPVTFTFAGCAIPTATPTPGPSTTPTVTPTPPPGSASCRQVTIVKIMHGGSEVANPSLAKIQKGDVVTFRGFATATNTSVTHINFVLTKSGTAQTPVSVVPTLVSGTYQADFTFTADIATTYSVSSSPVYQQ